MTEDFDTAVRSILPASSHPAMHMKSVSAATPSPKAAEGNKFANRGAKRLVLRGPLQGEKRARVRRSTMRSMARSSWSFKGILNVIQTNALPLPVPSPAHRFSRP